MAARVNTSFVIGLVVVLLAMVGGVAGLAYFSLSRSGETLMESGDEYYAAGDYDRAASYYGQAVFKDQTNYDWLVKYQSALEKTTPSNDLSYAEQYRNLYTNVKRNRALARPQDLDEQVQYVDELDRWLRLNTGGSANLLQAIVDAVEERLAGGLDPQAEDIGKLLRYRGLSQLAIAHLGGVESETFEQIQSDLEAAIGADPADIESRLGLLELGFVKARSERVAGRTIDAAAAFEEADATLEAYLTQNPNDPGGLALMMVRERELAASLPGGLTSDEARARLDGAAERLVVGLEQADPSTLSIGMLNPPATAAAFLDRDDLTERIEVVTGAIAGAEGETRILPAMASLFHARMQTQVGKLEEAMVTLEELIQRERPPLSLEGSLLPEHQVAARVQQLDIAIRIFEPSEGEERQAIRARIDEILAALDNEIVAQGRGQIDIRRAQLDLIEGRPGRAVETLSRLTSEQPGNVQVALLFAEALRRTGSPGEARRVFNTLIIEGRGTETVYARLAETLLTLEDVDEAERVARTGLESYENSESLRSVIARIESLRQAQAGNYDEVSDPVIRALVEARRVAAAEGPEAATALIENVLGEAPDDFRVLKELVQYDIARGDREGAGARIDAVIAANGSTDRLEQLKLVVFANDEKTAYLELIDRNDTLTDAEKEVLRADVWRRAGELDKAEAAVDRAIELDPEQPAVIGARFARILSRIESAATVDAALEREARILLERAAELDADRVDGRLFSGQLNLALGETSRAISDFEAAVEALPQNPPAWRLLGRARLAAGNALGATEALERAHQGNPRDAGIRFDYARALTAANQGREALELLAPGGTPRRDLGTDAVELWLTLEAEFGDRSRAIAVRRSAFEQSLEQARGTSDPAFSRNLAALSRLLELAGQSEEADAILSSAAERAEDLDPFVVTGLRARLLVQRDERDAAVAEIRSYLDATPSEQRTIPAYFLLSQIQSDADNLDGAIETLTEARQYQDSTRREADRRLGDMLTDRARLLIRTSRLTRESDPESSTALEAESRELFGRAADAYQAIVDAGTDDEDLTVTKRLAEVLLLADRYDNARVVLQQLSRTLPDERSVVLLQAELAQSEGDLDLSLDYYNRALQIDDTDANIFLRRARLLNTIGGREADVLADLDEAVRLDPSNIPAWRSLVGIYTDLERDDEAIDQLRRATEANPSNRQLRQTLIASLRNRPGRVNDLVTEISRAIEDFPSEIGWVKLAGDVQFEQGRFARAAERYEEVYDHFQESDPDGERADLAAADYLNSAILAGDEFSKRELRIFLERVQEIREPTASNFLLQARAYFTLGERETSNELIDDAFERAKKGEIDEQRMLVQQMGLMFENDHRQIAQAIESRAEFDELTPFLQVSLVRQVHLAKTGVPTDRLLERLRTVEVADDDNIFLQFEYHRLVFALAYELERYAEAVESGERTLVLSPSNVEMNNNVAYTLAKYLDRPEDALPRAEIAAQFAPRNSAVLDTYGLVLIELGRHAEAAPILQRAADTAPNDRQRAVALAHLGLAQLETEGADSARRSLADAESELAKVPDGPDRTDAEQAVSDLRAALTSP